MNRILVTGSNGQIGVELVPHLRKIYGADNVVATSRRKIPGPVSEGGPFEILDVNNGKAVADIIDKNKIDTIMHMAGVLSAVGESDPQLCWNTNMIGLH